MAWSVREPVFRARRAAEDLSKEVCREVADDEEHCRVGGVAKCFVDGEEAEVEEEDGEFVAEDADEVDHVCVVNPLIYREWICRLKWHIVDAYLTLT